MLQETFKHRTPDSGDGGWASPEDTTDDAFVLREDSPIGPNGRHPFDLEERTAVFGEKTVRPLRHVPSHVDFWSLELIWSLELGVWCFMLGAWMLEFGAL